METITDPAEIRATDEPDERGDFPCCTTPAPVGAGLDLDAVPRLARLVLGDALDRAESAEAEVRRLTRWQFEAMSVMAGLQGLGSALGMRLGESITGHAAAEAARALTARAESAEAEVGTLRAQVNGLHEELLRDDPDVVTLRAKVAAVEAKRDEFADLLARALPAVAALARVEALGDSNPDHADTCGSMLTPGAGYPCSCWQADLRAALATTGEG